MPCFYLTPEQDNVNQELQACIAEALYDVDSIVAGPGAYKRGSTGCAALSAFFPGGLTCSDREPGRRLRIVVIITRVY